MAPAWVEDIAQAALPGVKFAGSLCCFYYWSREGKIDAAHKYHHPKTAVKRLTATRHRRFSYLQQQQHIDILAIIYTARNFAHGSGVRILPDRAAASLVHNTQRFQTNNRIP
jgi:hypothetical protein